MIDKPMTLSELIQHLQSLLNEYGDLPVITNGEWTSPTQKEFIHYNAGYTYNTAPWDVLNHPHISIDA